MTRPAPDRGAILINAMVILAAIAFVATGLMALASAGQVRLLASAGTHQATLYASAAQALIPTLLAADRQNGIADHPGEVWATESYTVPIGRGTVSLAITDLQGRLNVNHLSVPGDTAPAEFAALFATLGLPSTLLQEVTAFLSPSGPAQPVAYLSRDLPVLPRGGAVQRVEQLAEVEGMTPDILARLVPYVTALPVEVQAINVNTAPAPVLNAVLGRVGIGADAVRVLIQDRDREPFASVIDFRARADALLGEGALELLALDRTSAGSSHFEARITARVDGVQAARLAQYRRDDTDDGDTRLEFSRLISAVAP
jgi:general secretion pathway protein K